MGYKASIAVADGRLSPEAFTANHVNVLAGQPALVEELMNLLSRAMKHAAG